jgi:hypothetical protein
LATFVKTSFTNCKRRATCRRDKAASKDIATREGTPNPMDEREANVYSPASGTPDP